MNDLLDAENPVIHRDEKSLRAIDIIRMNKKDIDELITPYTNDYVDFCNIYNEIIHNKYMKETYLIYKIAEDKFIYNPIFESWIDSFQNDKLSYLGFHILIQLIHMLYTTDDIIVYRILNILSKYPKMNIMEKLDRAFEHNQGGYKTDGTIICGVFLDDNGKKIVRSKAHFPKRTLQYKTLAKKIKNIDERYKDDDLWELYMYDRVSEERKTLGWESEMLENFIRILLEKSIFNVENIEEYVKKLNDFFTKYKIPKKWLNSLIVYGFPLEFLVGLRETSLRGSIFDKNVLKLIKEYF